ncbi:cyclin-dependent kinase inhibitor 1C [Lissotriton helveticus]
MSEVALSPAAAALQTLAGLPRAASGVRRSLFGPLDHGELRRELQSRLQGMAEEARDRWGFDFQAGRPVPGSGLLWEPVCGSVVPAFYREKSQGSCRPGQGAEAPAEGTSVCAAGPGPAAASDCAGEESNRENRDLGPCARGGVRRPAEGPCRITDFFPKRKRSVDTKAPCDLLPSSGFTIPVEQTPRKRLR